MTGITLKEQKLMLHALGIGYGKDGQPLMPKKRYRPLPVIYRNHYQIDDDCDWNTLVKKGFAKKSRNLDMNFYIVTKKGISKLKDIGYLFKEE